MTQAPTRARDEKNLNIHDQLLDDIRVLLQLEDLLIRILLADDHEVVRQGLAGLLSQRQGWEVCAEAANGRDAVKFAIKYRPDVAIIDLSMPELNGLEATRQIKQE